MPQSHPLLIKHQRKHKCEMESWSHSQLPDDEGLRCHVTKCSAWSWCWRYRAQWWHPHCGLGECICHCSTLSRPTHTLANKELSVRKPVVVNAVSQLTLLPHSLPFWYKGHIHILAIGISSFPCWLRQKLCPMSLSTWEQINNLEMK